MFWKRKKDDREKIVDERVHVNPTISVALKEQIERLAFILGQPVNLMGKLLFIWGINNRDVVTRLSKNFINDGMIFDKTIFFGHERNRQLLVVIEQPSERISIRFDDDGHHDVLMYTNLLGFEDKSKTVALVMSYAIRHPAIIEDLLRNQNYRMHFDEVVIDELKKLIKFIGKNPYEVEWNQSFLQVIYPRKRPARLVKPVTQRCIDTETYKWHLD